MLGDKLIAIRGLALHKLRSNQAKTDYQLKFILQLYIYCLDSSQLHGQNEKYFQTYYLHNEDDKVKIIVIMKKGIFLSKLKGHLNGQT